MIAGLPRSGTTLIQALLNQNEHTFTLPETHYFELARKLSLPEKLSKDQSIKLLQQLSEKWQLSINDLLSQIKNSSQTAELDLYDLFFQVIEQYRPEGEPALVGIEKTPGNLFAIKELLQRDYDLSIILSTRNPWDFANSMWKQYWAPDSLHKIAQMWNDSLKSIRQLVRLYPDKVIVTDYDDLISMPEQEFSKIYDFVKLPWDASNLKNINANSDQFILPAESKWKQGNLTLSEVKKSVNRPVLSLMQRAQLHRICFPTALALGYCSNYKF